MTRIREIESALRSLDAADSPADSSADSPADRHAARALTDLQRILATDPSSAPPGRPSAHSGAHDSPPTKRRRAARTPALAGATLVAVAAGVVALPPVSGGDTAFASWTPHPEALPALDRPEAADECRRSQQDGSSAAPLSSAEPVIAERRGVWTTVVLAGPNGSAMCVTDESRPFFSRGTIGHVGTRSGYSAPRSRELTADALGSGTLGDRPLSLAVGTAGSDIVAVTYRSSTYGDVRASVSRGHFALWFPGTELEDASSAGAQFHVTYRDGSTGSRRLTI